MAESRFPFICYGDVIIDNDRRQNSGDVELQLVDTSSVDGLCFEEFPYSIAAVFPLRQCTESAEEVAVAKCTLTDILRIDTIREDLRAVEDLTATLPFELQLVRIITQGLVVGFKISISPRLSCVDDILYLFRRLLVVMMVLLNDFFSLFTWSIYLDIHVAFEGFGGRHEATLENGDTGVVQLLGLSLLIFFIEFFSGKIFRVIRLAADHEGVVASFHHSINLLESELHVLKGGVKALRDHQTV